MKQLLFYMSVFVLLVMHAAGIYGILYENKEEYVNLTAINLLITFTILIINFDFYTPKLFLFLFLVAITGFMVEVAGVYSKFIFGNYNYGNHLGPQAWNVPLIIGINWALLIFSVGAAVQRIKLSIWTRSAVGAIMMVLLDLLIEPVAVKLGYWQWELSVIPIQNYVAWGIISFVMLYACFHFLNRFRNKTGLYIYLVQVIFFSLLNLLL